ncbi:MULTISPECIES: phytoene desaturase family protein [Cyanophyceae]|uniref:phytoene desaturase family protein n=1 Tax=Cyanophyceae TaxID=3028117 RepID=UPI00232F7CB5|nr:MULTISPECIES: NAD(P)/FAD-dependent oxidoreductase [Cyanophyceae]MDB9356743.1 NAD(P)/FAD-dependent oxidoreductase [Nodularia spumigena CS-587/03]MDB9340097.1 NAD(P)/FAD-dependent oxidoreductase [Nodularia spumigena CS-589/07]MDB9399433.1 NAD(P)/FAD-dependent oxidoreductase [Microcystis aeruginosa CS-567/02-A1]MDB9498781.1 NAD(P)/FAD-dependent oxidoreductase [Nodularia spumigena CS-336/02]MDB9531520.1 NAD(P)/FAD-dependent oxidoreductase [Nodularia spumigena CS-1038]
MNSALNTQHSQSDVIVIGSGIGGLCAAGLLARYGKQVIVCESHAIPGGAAHSFRRRGFEFDSGPSFYCGLTDTQSLNPVKQILDVLGESLQVIPYDPLGHYHFPEAIFAVYGNAEKYLNELHKITPQGAKEFQQFAQRLLGLYEGMKGIPTLALRADWQVILVLITRYLPSLAKMLPNLPLVQSSVGNVMDATVKDPWVRRLIDLECFLLSGLKAHGTIAPEVAFMLGERSRAGVEYPVGGSGAIVNALVRGLERWGGKLRLGCHVEQILVESGKAVGVKLQNGEILQAPIVISNATIWDTYNHLLRPEDLPASYRQVALETPAVDSFMHLHLGIKANGLENLTGHHVVVHDSNQDISVPGNTCMISIPSVWDATLAPEGHHVVHAYTLEPYAGWERNHGYEARKQEKAQSLYRALERIIPDIRQRVVLELIGTPLTHAHYLRRYQGTYGPAIVAGKGMFPGTQTPIKGLYRVGDSTMPGIGVPAVAASGILCANSLVSPRQTAELL